MARFYVALDQILEGEIVITGPDVSHIRNVLRMKAGDRLTACDGQGRDYICEITALEREEIRARELFCSETASELPVRLVLFQGLPKKDKMELIIQKVRGKIRGFEKRGKKAGTLAENCGIRGQAVRKGHHSFYQARYGVCPGVRVCQSSRYAADTI